MTTQIICPACANPIGRQLSVSDPGATPSPGDSTICGYCRALLIFADTAGEVRYPTNDEWLAAMRNPDVQRTIALVGELHRMGVVKP